MVERCRAVIILEMIWAWIIVIFCYMNSPWIWYLYLLSDLMKELLFLHSGSIASVLSPVHRWSNTQLWLLKVTWILNTTHILNFQICFHKIAEYLLSTNFHAHIVQLLNIHRKWLWSSPNPSFNLNECKRLFFHPPLPCIFMHCAFKQHASSST